MGGVETLTVLVRGTAETLAVLIRGTAGGLSRGHHEADGLLPTSAECMSHPP